MTVGGSCAALTVCNFMKPCYIKMDISLIIGLAFVAFVVVLLVGAVLCCCIYTECCSKADKVGGGTDPFSDV